MRPPIGLFGPGNDPGVGKTHVAAMIARAAAAQGAKVGVYKPVASGCRTESGSLLAADAQELWRGAGSPGAQGRARPRRVAAGLGPRTARRAEGEGRGR